MVKKYYSYKPQSTETSAFTGVKLAHFCSNNIPYFVGLSAVNRVVIRKIHTWIILKWIFKE